MIRYSVHDFVDVVIDRRVDPLVRRAIEFQVGAFGGRDGGARPGIPSVAVRPYRDFQRPPSHDVYAFNDMFTDLKTFLDEPTRRIATVHESGGFHLFADEPILVTLYIQLLLARQDLTLLHAAGMVDRGGRVLLVAGGGGVGKTALLGHLVGNGDWRLLGDDLVCLSAGGECYSFLRHFVLKEYHRAVFPSAFRKRSWWRAVGIRTITFARANAPFVGVAKDMLTRLGLREHVAHRIPSSETDQQSVPIAELFGVDRVASSGHLDRMVFLTRHTGPAPQWSTVPRQLLAGRLFSIVHHEISSSLRSLLALGAVDLIDVSAYFSRVARIVERALANRTVDQLSIPFGASPQGVADAVLSKVQRGQ